MFVITEYEKQKAYELSDSLWNALQASNDGMLFYKVLYNFIVNKEPSKFHFKEKDLRDNELMKKNFDELYQYMVDISSQEVNARHYTTGQIAKYFGVSVSSVNNWIMEGRFSHVDKAGRNKHARISENSTWKTNSGEILSVKKIIEDWNKNYAKYENVTPEEEKQAILQEIAFYEKKYGGLLENTLLSKDKLSEEELDDIKEWRYWLKRAKG